MSRRIVLYWSILYPNFVPSRCVSNPYITSCRPKIFLWKRASLKRQAWWGRANPAYLAHLHLPSTEFLLWDNSGHLYVQIGCIVASQFRSNHDFTTILRLSGVFCHDIWIHMDDYGWLWMNVAIKPTAINLKPSQIPNHLGRWTPFQIDPNSGIPCYSQK